MQHIAIFASGNGSNAQRIIDYFNANGRAKVNLVICNKPNAFVIERAKKSRIPVLLINKENFYHSNFVLDELKKSGTNLIVLAGFLWMMPENIILAYENKIVNVHPALLPKFGGKGMYGMNVHKAVIEASEKESGITIHYVNEHYDEGRIIFQGKCVVDKTDTPESLAKKIQELEHKYFPEVIEKLITQ